MVLVLLYAHVKRFNDSRMQNFFSLSGKFPEHQSKILDQYFTRKADQHVSENEAERGSYLISDEPQ